MKKRIIIALLVILLLVAGLFAYVLTNASSIVRVYKPQIEQIASDTLGVPVKLGDIDVAVFPATKLIVNEFSLGKVDDQFQLKNLTFRANLLALAQGKIDIREVSFAEPVITVIQEPSGTRIAGLPKFQPKAKKKGKKDPKEQAAASDPTANIPDGISLNLEKFQVSNATIRVVNKNKQQLIALNDINIHSTVSFAENVATLPSFSFTAKLNNKEPLEASGKNITLNIRSKDINIPELAAKAFGGIYNSSVNLDGQQKLTTQATLEGVLFERVIEGLKPDMRSPISGTLEKFTYNLSGSLKGNPAQNIAGPITVALKEGVLRDTNMAGAVLKEIMSLPFIGDAVLDSEEQAAVQADKTPLKSLTGTFQLANGAMTTDDLKVDSALFDMNGKGKLTVNGEIDFKTSFLFTSMLSAKLTSKVKELQDLLNDEGRLFIPVAIQGKATKIIVLPDVSSLAEFGAKKALEKGAEKLLNKALGNSGSADVKIKDLGSVFGF